MPIPSRVFRRRATRLCGAVLALTTLPVAAQVTVFGVLDAGLQVGRGDGSGSVQRVSGDGNTSSRLGFRGSENLGSGWRVNFWVEAAVNSDTGLGGASSTNNKDSVNTGGLTFGRRTTVGLQGPWGEVRMGRDYVPSFANLTTAMHPFGTNGVGSSGHLFYPVAAGGTTPRTQVRASNAVGYHLPELASGLYGAAMVALGEQPTGTATARDGQYQGFRLGWRKGGVNMAVSTGRTRYATGDYRQTNAGANLQWGPGKWMVLWGENRVGATSTRTWMLGTQLKAGAHGEVRLAWSRLSADRVANDATHVALGYVHNLSRRTALYATVARVDNHGNGLRFGPGVNTTVAGGAAQGADLGIRHSF